MKALKKSDLLFPELSYQINGCAFSVHNELGSGHLEKTYQKALAIEFTNSDIKFIEQKHIPVKYLNSKISSITPDFLVEEKIVVDIKRSGRITPDDYEQAKRYLKFIDYKLCLLIHFGLEGVISKRVINL